MTVVTTADTPDDVGLCPAIGEPRIVGGRRAITGAMLLTVGIICALGWGLGSGAGRTAFQFSETSDTVSIPLLHVPTGSVPVALGAGICVLGLWTLVRRVTTRQLKWIVTAASVLFVVSFLCWAGTGASGSTIDLVGVLQNSLFLAVPLILGAMSGLVCERTGVINIAIEGQMLVGAFAGALVASVANSANAGLPAALVAGGLVGALLAVFAIKYKVNQVVLGVVISLLALGMTGYGYDALMSNNPGDYNSGLILKTYAIPGFSDIPVLGRVLFDGNIILYATYVIIIAIDFTLVRTTWGLRSRAVGEHPMAADTVGIDVLRTRYVNVITGGMIAGLAGAFLTIGSSGHFAANALGMTAGKGYIALAALIFGKWTPRGAIGAALLFGFTSELQTLVSVVPTPSPIPSDVLLALPYIVTVAAVVAIGGGTHAPAADGVPYERS